MRQGKEKNSHRYVIGCVTTVARSPLGDSLGNSRENMPQNISLEVRRLGHLSSNSHLLLIKGCSQGQLTPLFPRDILALACSFRQKEET